MHVKFFVWLVICVAAVFVVAHVVTDASQTETNPRRTAAAPIVNGSSSRSKPLQAVSAMRLYADYHHNEVSADVLYRGQRLQVRGIVTEIRKDFTDDPIVELYGLNRYENVLAYMRLDTLSQVGTMSPGQVLTVDCLGSGMVIGSPVLKDCSVSDPAPVPIPEPVPVPAATAPVQTPDSPDPYKPYDPAATTEP